MTLLAPPERQPMLDAISQFAARSVGHLRDQPQQCPDEDVWKGILSAAKAAGLIDGDTESGYLWRGDDSDDLAISCDLLSLIASYHGGVAFCVHRLALGARIAQRLGLTSTAAVFPWLPTGHLIAHPSFPTLITGKVTKTVLLPVPGAGVIWQAAPVDHHVLLPCSDGEHHRWTLLSRSDWADISIAASHGLDGINTCSALLPDVRRTDASSASDVLVELMRVDAMGLMAVALGSMERASQQATAQAALRRQGGKAIGEHPAVQLMLADIRIALDTGATLLAASIHSSPDTRGYRALCANRVVFHETMCRAANSAMQVFGGMGYMRDMGLERIVREHNQLRMTAGAPDDLRLLIARGATSI